MIPHDEDTHDMFGDDGLDETALTRNLDAVHDVDQRHWPKRLVEICDVIAATLMRRDGVEPQQAKRFAREIAAALAKYFGGMQIYLPCGKELELALRNEAIWNEFTGHNHDELVRRYRLTKVQIYNILERQRHLHVSRNQFSIPFEIRDASGN